jgi:hypothetical protein
MYEQMVIDSDVFASIRAAVYRERTTRPTAELLASAPPVESHGATSAFDITGDRRAAEVQKGERERLREWHLMQTYRKFASRLSLDFDPFLDCVNGVSIGNKEQAQKLDWIPLFPFPHENGFDIAKDIADFRHQYHSTHIQSMVGRKLDMVVRVHVALSELISTRLWRAKVPADENPEDLYVFIRSMARMSLLAMAFAGRTKSPFFSRDIASIYLTHCLLEQRIHGKENAVEGIRLLKYA